MESNERMVLKKCCESFTLVWSKLPSKVSLWGQVEKNISLSMCVKNEKVTTEVSN